MPLANLEIADCDLKVLAGSAEGCGNLFAMSDHSEKDAALEVVSAPAIQKRILLVRERQVMLDEDLAELYGVETRRLIEQVKRTLHVSRLTSCSS